MVDVNRHAPYVVAGIGILLGFVLPEIIENSASTTVLVGITIVGGALLWGGALWDDRNRRSRCMDERLMLIYYRAGYVAFLGMIVVLSTTVIALSNAGLEPDVVLVTAGSGFVGVGLFAVARAYFKRRM